MYVVLHNQIINTIVYIYIYKYTIYIYTHRNMYTHIYFILYILRYVCVHTYMHTFKNNVYLSHCFTYDSFVEIWLTYHKIHPFKVYILVVFVYSELCSHRYNLILEHFISPESMPVPISSYSTFPEGRTWQKLTRLAPVFWVQTCPTGRWPLRTSGEYHLAHRKPSQTPLGDRPFKPRSGGPFRA